MALSIFSPSMTTAHTFEESCGGLITRTGLLNPPNCTHIGTLGAVNFNDGKFLLIFFHIKDRNTSLLIDFSF